MRAQTVIFLCAVVVGQLLDYAALQAQPASDLVPKNRESVPVKDALEGTDGQTDSIEAQSIPSNAGPTSVNEDTIVTGDSEKPWNWGVPAESRQVARELFLEGNRRFRIPLFTKAAEKYQAALAKWKHPAFYFNLALAQLNLGLEVEARENLERALQYGDEPLGQEQFQEAERQLNEVERRLGRVRVKCKTEGAEVTLDGVRLFTGPGSYEGWAKAGIHEVTARKIGHLSEARRVTVSSSQLLEVELRLVTLSEATDASRRWASWKPWAVVGSGIIIGAVGGLSHKLAFRNFEVFDDKFQDLPCAAPKQGPPGCTEQQIDTSLRVRMVNAKREQMVAMGSYITSGALIFTGIVLLYLNRPRLVEESTARSRFYNAKLGITADSDMLGILINISQ